MNKFPPRVNGKSPHRTPSMFARLLASIRNKGVVHTVRAARHHTIVIVSRLRDLDFDKVHGTETSLVVETEQLNVESENKTRGIRYQPTRARPFRRLMRELRIPHGEVFVDIGSGKGRTLLIASEFGFRKVIGVDYAADMCEAARENLARRRNQDVEVVIRHCDAVDYDFDEGDTVIYLYNPFDAEVLSAMMARLTASLKRAPRKAWLIYNNPLWQSAVMASGLFMPALHRTYGGCEFSVFVYDPEVLKE